MRIVLFLSVVLTLSAGGQTKNPFQSLKLDKVIIYDYEPSGEDPTLVDPKGKFVASSKIEKQVQLDTTAIKQLNKKLGEKTSYGQVTGYVF